MLLVTTQNVYKKSQFERKAWSEYSWDAAVIICCAFLGHGDVIYNMGKVQNKKLKWN